MMRLVYKNQAKWSESPSAKAEFVKYAKKLELNIETFKADRESESVTGRINADLERSRFLELSAAPTVVFNGRILSFKEAGNLEKIIEKQLSK